MSWWNTFYNTGTGSCPDGRFITEWAISSGTTFHYPLDESVNITTNNDFMIDWGDGTPLEHVTGDTISHYYISGGTNTTIIVEGDVNGIFAYNRIDLLKIRQWGGINIISPHAFYNNINLEIIAPDAPTLLTDSTYNMFYGCLKITQVGDNWDLSKVLIMNGMFAYCGLFNQNINSWNVSNVTEMNYLFYNALIFNQDLNDWDVHNVIRMNYLFHNALLFNGNISNWDVSSVIEMISLLDGCGLFNQDISRWNVTSVIFMTNLLRDAQLFNQNIGNWVMSSVVNISGLLSGTLLFNHDITRWDVSNVVYMTNFAAYARAFNQDLSIWNISNVEYMDNIFTESLLSTQNYSNILNGWSQLIVQPDVELGAGTIKYLVSSQNSRDILTNPPNNWVITDGGVI